MESEQKNLNLNQLSKQIKLGIAVALIAAGGYLGYETFSMVKSVLTDPTSLKKWVDIRPSIMAEPVEIQAPPKPKIPGKPDDLELNPMTRWVFLGYFLVLLGILYSYILVKISLAFITSGIQLLTHTTKEK